MLVSVKAHISTSRPPPGESRNCHSITPITLQSPLVHRPPIYQYHVLNRSCAVGHGKANLSRLELLLRRPAAPPRERPKPRSLMDKSSAQEGNRGRQRTPPREEDNEENLQSLLVRQYRRLCQPRAGEESAAKDVEDSKLAMRTYETRKESSGRNQLPPLGEISMTPKRRLARVSVVSESVTTSRTRRSRNVSVNLPSVSPERGSGKYFFCFETPKEKTVRRKHLESIIRDLRVHRTLIGSRVVSKGREARPLRLPNSKL